MSLNIVAAWPIAIVGVSDRRVSDFGSVDDWGKLLGDSAAVTAMLDRLLHHAMYLNAVHGVGARKQTCLHTRRRSKTT